MAIQTHGQVLVNKLADGTSLDTVFAEIQEATNLFNNTRSAIQSLLCYETTSPAIAAPQRGWGEEYSEEATEFGIPRSVGTADYLKLGLSFKDYDLRVASTWKFLRAATQEQVTHSVQRVYEAHNKLITGAVLNRIFCDETRENDWGHTVYPLWDGTPSAVPPPHNGQKFGVTNHYLTTASTTIDADDISAAKRLLTRFGFGTTPGSRIVLLIHPNDFDASGMTAWRANVEYDTGKKAKYDWIPSSNAPAFISAESIHGAVPPADYAGLPVHGSFDDVLVVSSWFVPQGWCTVVATGGPNSEQNVVGLRINADSDYQGLRLIPGVGPYPLQDSFFAVGFGTGVLRRGGAVAIQITDGTNYAAPAIKFSA